jgi:hemolysin III
VVGPVEDAQSRPRLRGVLHQWAAVIAVPLGIALGLQAKTGRGTLSAALFAASVVLMFAASGLYHRPAWTPAWRSWLRRLDHAGIYLLIAGTYTPFGLVVLRDDWREVVLAVVWSGAAAALILRFVWPTAPKWTAAIAGVSLGWVGFFVFPRLADRAGLTCALLVLAGGLCYTVGALVYSLRRPDPRPAVFGYQELFHVLVIAAVAFEYAAIAFYVVPT